MILRFFDHLECTRTPDLGKCISANESLKKLTEFSLFKPVVDDPSVLRPPMGSQWEGLRRGMGAVFVMGSYGQFRKIGGFYRQTFVLKPLVNWWSARGSKNTRSAHIFETSRLRRSPRKRPLGVCALAGSIP